MRHIVSLLAFAAALAASAQVDPGAAASGEKPKLAVSLVSEVKAAAPGKAFRVAVKLEHAPTFHTYGKTLPPDVIGKPTELKWELPAGWKAEDLDWPPAHKVPSTDGKESEGYDGIVHLPAKIIPPADAAAGSKATIKVKVDALVCDPKSCMPAVKEVSLDIPIAAQEELNADAKDVFAEADKQQAKPPPQPQAKAKDSLLKLLLFGFIGGLILNIMPCVFPVLGIKIVGVVQQAGEDKSVVVKHGIAYTIGVLVCYWVLAAIAVSLGKAWGQQFQNPAFVYGMTIFFLIFGMNMAGVFEIGASAVGVGSNLTAKSGLSGSFFSGLLAVIVSTPCSAPFLGTALAAALALPVAGAVAFFTVIGLGLAFPYLLLSLFPNATALLPRPGAWMESFKQFMSFLLFGTVAYFIWTLAGMVQEVPFRSALFSLVLIAMACWIYGRWTALHLKPPVRIKGFAFTAIALAAGLWLGWPRAAEKDELQWIAWTPELVKMHHEELKEPVYIDYTARWCATCQWNKRLYKEREVKELFKSSKAVLLKADWTNYDDVITKALFDIQRAAVPVNVLYIPGQKEPFIFDENLTVQNLKDGFAKLPKKE